MQGVVADGERLGLVSEENLLVCDQAAQPNGVHRDPVHVGARAPSSDVVVASGWAGSSAVSRAWAMSCAVRTAVPLGASAFPG